MTDKDFTKILLDLSGDIGDIKGAVGTLSGKVDYSISLHENCTARLGFDALKDKTANMKLTRMSEPVSAAPVSQFNSFLKAIAPYLWKGALIFGLAIGASIVARISTSDLDQEPTIRAIQAVSDIVAKTDLGVTRIEEKQIIDLDAGQ
jgi:hypothetical protein